jgi:hypothetical protein
MLLMTVLYERPSYVGHKGNQQVKVKVKLTLGEATKAQTGSRYIALLFL